MSAQNRPLRLIATDSPITEIWSMLSFFESGFNVENYLKKKLGSSIANIGDTSSNIALSMKAAREYYKAAEEVSILTQPVLLFYGMSALSKVLFGTTHGKASPSRRHGLQEVEGWNGTPSDLSVRILKDGTFRNYAVNCPNARLTIVYNVFKNGTANLGKRQNQMFRFRISRVSMNIRN